jgi:hypothetical protein
MDYYRDTIKKIELSVEHSDGNEIHFKIPQGSDLDSMLASFKGFLMAMGYSIDAESELVLVTDSEREAEANDIRQLEEQIMTLEGQKLLLEDKVDNLLTEIETLARAQAGV